MGAIMLFTIIELLIFLLCLIIAYPMVVLFFTNHNLFTIFILGSIMYSLLCILRLMVILNKLLNQN